MGRASKFCVAIVDDDPAIRRLMRLLLRRSGYEIVEFVNGTEAREQMMEKIDWDLAILDRRLPDMDGVELCHELKTHPEFKARYIIMLTGEAEPKDKIEGLDLGADDYITKPFQAPELLARIRAARRIVELQKELIETNKRLELLSITDGLTGLYNHRYFQGELSRAFEESERYGRPLSLAIIDLDFFKKINDTHGHAVGDEVLKAVSRIFQDSIRSTDLAARYGGEEFALMMPETTLQDAVVSAEKIRALIASRAVSTQAGPIAVTVSIGVGTLPDPDIGSAHELIVVADGALYGAKRGGRNQVQAARGQASGRRHREFA